MIDPNRRTTSWRGESGQAYPCTVLTVQEVREEPGHRGVAIAVRRDTAGIARMIGKPVPRLTPAWLAQVAAGGATEIHLHEPSSPARADAVVDDLKGAA